MGMFAPKTNDGFYDLGLAVAQQIGERLEREGVGRATHSVLQEFDLTGDSDQEVEMKSEKEGWREEKDSRGRSVWVET
jgi:hypothetical protein